jgi:hypothetical protein
MARIYRIADPQLQSAKRIIGKLRRELAISASRRGPTSSASDYSRGVMQLGFFFRSVTC